MEKLNSASSALGQAMYAAAAEQQQAQPTAETSTNGQTPGAEQNGDTAGEDDVVDAEVVDEESQSSSDAK
jgi:hypothetical protein